MQIRYNVTGERRKALVAVMRDALQDTTRYLGAPSFAYQVGAYTVDRNGTILCPEGCDTAEVDMLMRELERDGFVGERIGELVMQQSELADITVAAESTEPVMVTPIPRFKEPAPENNDRLSIELPKDGMTPIAMQNLRRLVASKATLLKKAIGTDSLPITEYEDRIGFAWFRPTNEQAELIAYSRLLAGLCTLARTLKRASGLEQPAENEKYAFRCFLLRLGFIGAECKEARKILLRNLSGNAAFKAAQGAEGVE